MKRFIDNKDFNKVVLSTCKSREDELKTQPNLSYTTGEMFDMWKKGVPINNEHAATKFFDGSKDCTFEIPLTDQRGIDVADVWEAQQAARSKFRSYKPKKDD